jgi:cell fate (sporulation/competence/biofilm development) regulator YmcA (YheA/YmcA/DUF963 family)
METEHTAPKNYQRSLLTIAELIKAIVEEMSEQEVPQSSSQQQFADDYHQSLLAIAELIKAIVEKMSEQEVQQSASEHQITDEFTATGL